MVISWSLWGVRSSNDAQSFDDAAFSDTDVLEKAASSKDCASLDDLTPQRLQEITISRGVDFATALLFDRIKRADRNTSFVAQIARLEERPADNLTAAACDKIKVGIVPAAFYREKPHSG